MSERKLRDAAKAILEEGVDVVWSTQWTSPIGPVGKLEKALDDEPDVVALIKDQRHWLELAGGDPGDVINPYDPFTDMGKAWWRGYRQAVADSIRDLPDKYGFRLTDDGSWEYTDDQP